MKIIKQIPFIVVIIFIINGCSGEDMGKNQHTEKKIKTIDQIPQEQWDSLSQKKIFFGHQSVGNNIMQGINEIISDNKNIKLNINEITKISDFEQSNFSHFSNIGKNDYPLSKIEAFVQFMNDGAGSKLDIAFLKFCFVDFKYGNDYENVFNEYKKSIAEIKTKYPEMTIVHFTAPLLKKEQAGIIKRLKAFIKGVMGKEQDNFWSNSHNAVRNQYNQLLLSHYSAKEPIFDIARLESTYPTGKIEIFSYDSNQYYALVPEYTDDGAHLNEKGRKYIAEQLLIFLANL